MSLRIFRNVYFFQLYLLWYSIQCIQSICIYTMCIYIYYSLSFTWVYLRYVLNDKSNLFTCQHLSLPYVFELLGIINKMQAAVEIFCAWKVHVLLSLVLFWLWQRHNHYIKFLLVPELRCKSASSVIVHCFPDRLLNFWKISRIHTGILSLTGWVT